VIKNIIKLICTDGLLHFLACYAIILTFSPLIGILGAIGIAGALSIVKEAWDYFYEKDNNVQQVLHDLICDVIGILGALIVMLLW
jgi:hypothetical protein